MADSLCEVGMSAIDSLPIPIPEVNPQVLEPNVTAEARLITAKPCFNFLSVNVSG